MSDHQPQKGVAMTESEAIEIIASKTGWASERTDEAVRPFAAIGIAVTYLRSFFAHVNINVHGNAVYIVDQGRTKTFDRHSLSMVSNFADAMQQSDVIEWDEIGGLR